MKLAKLGLTSAEMEALGLCCRYERPIRCALDVATGKLTKARLRMRAKGPEVPECTCLPEQLKAEIRAIKQSGQDFLGPVVF